MGVVFKKMIAISLRDKITLFYSTILPIALLIGLGFYFGNANYIPILFIGVIALSTIFWGVSGVAFQVYWQRSQGVYKLLKLTPYPIIHFIFVVTLARTILGILMNISVLVIGLFVFDISFSIFEILLMTLTMILGLLCFTCMGFLIANFANNEGQINVISNIIYLPMIFSTDTFYSLANAPEWIVKIGEFFPLTYFLQIMRAAAGFHSFDQSVYLSIIMLILYTFGLLLLSAITFKWDTNDKPQLKIIRKNKKGTA